MSVRRDFLKEAEQIVGQRPKGVLVENYKDGVLITYSENKGDWVYDCEDKLSHKFKIWVQMAAVQKEK